MSAKELGKYEVVPTLEQLMAVVEFFERHVTSMGRVNFTQRQMLESATIAPHFNSPSYLNGVNTYLFNEGYITKISTGRRSESSVWDVSKLLKDWKSILTREDLGASRPVRDDNERIIVPEDVEVEVSRNKEEPIVKSHGNNSAVLSELKDAMADMMGYLQNLPIEMGGHLRSISSQLELTDEKALVKLQQDKAELQEKYGKLQIRFENETNQLKSTNEELKKEVESLRAELESKADFNAHAIYRQRNAIMDEVDRMCNAPAWTVKQNKNHYHVSIETKLNAIMAEIGIKEEE
jgi:hypothetical protein